MDRRKDDKDRVLKEGEYQRSNGTYEYKWRDDTGQRHSIYAKNLTELRKKEYEVQRNTFDGIRNDAANMTVNDMYDRWVEVKRGLKNNTFAGYRYSYTQYVQPRFGQKKLVDVKKSDVRNFYNTLIEQRHLKFATVDSVNTVLHQVFSLAVDDEYIRSNPSDNALKELRKVRGSDTEKRRALTLPEQDLFEKTLTENVNEVWEPVFTVMLWTGMRVGEITGLRWDDIDLDEGMISVNHTLVYYSRGKDSGGNVFAINTPKTVAGERIIPMLPQVKEAFAKEKALQKELEVKCNSTVDGYTNFIFINRFGNVQHQGSLNKALRRIIRDCNEGVISEGGKLTLPPFSCHSLRHTFCTRLIESGMNIKAIQEIMGHADIETTMDIYAEATKDLKKSEMTKFDDFFRSMKSKQDE